MSKHKRVGDEKEKVGKAGAPASGTKNEQPADEGEESASLPKVSKKETGGGERRGGGGLH